MSIYKYMRIIVMYDLPNNDKEENKEYTKFRKLLIKNGYTMVQFSVYSKSINLVSKYQNEVNKLKTFIPTQGNIRIFYLTEKQYNEMIFLCGENTINEKVNGTERFIKIEE